MTVTCPVAVFICNRPIKTRGVWSRIRNAEPETLYIVADGPADMLACKEARTVVNTVDWPCDVHRLYADDNLGLKDRFVTAFEEIFSNETRCMFLEDDCVPNSDFFRFCDELLDYYADDKRVWDISGTNYLETWRDDEQDYHFSYYGGIWGWATWRDRWEAYDADMDLWDDATARQRLRDVIADKSQYEYLRAVYRRAAEDGDTWDYPWGFARQINSGLSVVPSRNLVSNIGFDPNATNTTNPDDARAAVSRDSLDWPLSHPECIAVDRAFDEQYHRQRTARWQRVPTVRRLSDEVIRRVR